MVWIFNWGCDVEFFWYLARAGHGTPSPYLGAVLHTSYFHNTDSVTQTVRHVPPTSIPAAIASKIYCTSAARYFSLLISRHATCSIRILHTFMLCGFLLSLVVTDRISQTFRSTDRERPIYSSKRGEQRWHGSVIAFVHHLILHILFAYIPVI